MFAEPSAPMNYDSMLILSLHVRFRMILKQEQVAMHFESAWLSLHVRFRMILKLATQPNTVVGLPFTPRKVSNDFETISAKTTRYVHPFTPRKVSNDFETASSGALAWPGSQGSFVRIPKN